jgi:hypothetical protein
MDHRHFLLGHDSRVHFCIPFAVANGVEDVYFLALCFGVHAPLDFGIFGLIDYIFQRRMPSSEGDSGYQNMAMPILVRYFPEYNEVE